MKKHCRGNSPSIKTGVRYGELDVFRGVAVMLVVLFHCTMFRDEANYGFFLGISGVDLFFMISGFVILMSAEKKKNPNLFAVSRIIRLYPTYWIIATFTFLTRLIVDYYESPIPFTRIPTENYLANLTMIQYYLGVPNMDGSYWTLIVELLFYILIYLILLMGWIKKIVAVGTIICALMAIIFGTISLGWLPDFTSTLPLLYHFPLFFVGILFYKIKRNKKLGKRYIPLILGALILQICVHSYGRATLFMPVWAYASTVLVYFLLFTLFITGKLKFMVNRYTTFIGEISYALYLIHQPLTYGLIIPYFVDILQFPFWLTTLLIAIPLTIVLAALVTYKLERPILGALRRKIRPFFK